MGRKNWIRALHLNMSDPQQPCPSSSFRLVTQDGLRLCGRSNGPGCKSVFANTNNLPYQRVCGRATMFRYYSTDGFERYVHCPGCTIEDPYVDGLSITYGSSGNRKHAWSFVVLPSASSVNFRTPPNFVGKNFFCGAATHHAQNRLYSHDPLFTDQWFCVQLPQPTTERLEMRLCSDETLDNEDVLFQLVELYVK